MNNDFDDNNNSHIDIDDYDNKDNHLQIHLHTLFTVSKELWQRKNTCQFDKFFSFLFLFIMFCFGHINA